MPQVVAQIRSRGPNIRKKSSKSIPKRAIWHQSGDKNDKNSQAYKLKQKKDSPGDFTLIKVEPDSDEDSEDEDSEDEDSEDEDEDEDEEDDDETPEDLESVV